MRCVCVQEEEEEKQSQHEQTNERASQGTQVTAYGKKIDWVCMLCM